MANIQEAITEKIQRLQDLNKQMKGIGDKIGVLQEEGRALHNAALEVKGAIEALAGLAAKEEEAKKGLILPDKTLVGADGKTAIASDAPVAPAAEPAAPVLDVVQ